MDVQLRAHGNEFRALAARMKGADKEIRKVIGKSMREATKPAEEAAKQAILGIDSKGTSGGGKAQRKAHDVSRSKSKRPVRAGVTARHGLRAKIAKGITRKISYTGFRLGVRIRADAKYLPDDQKSLVKATNRGHWRHPAGWGSNRGSVWVDQTVTPARWFDDTMKREGPLARDRIADAARQALRRLQ